MCNFDELSDSWLYGLRCMFKGKHSPSSSRTFERMFECFHIVYPLVVRVLVVECGLSVSHRDNVSCTVCKYNILFHFPSVFCKIF